METIKEVTRRHFLTKPNPAFISAIMKKDSVAVQKYVESNTDLQTIRHAFTFVSHRRDDTVLSLHLQAIIALKNGRHLVLVRALSYESRLAESNALLFANLGLCYAQPRDGFSLVNETSGILFPWLKHVGMRDCRPEIFWPECTIHYQIFLAYNLNTREVEPVQMNGIDDGFNDEVYLMDCVAEDEWHNRLPKTHWLYDANLTAHIPKFYFQRTEV